MKVSDIVERAGLQVKAGADHLDTEITGGYAGEVISAAMASAEEGNVWITWHVHPNIVAAALVVKMAAIVLIMGRQPEEETVNKAEQEGLPLLVSEKPAFEIIGQLYGMVMPGTK